MLTEPDMQAHYIAATLDVLTAELNALDAPADRRAAILALTVAAAREAHRLADALAPQAKAAMHSARPQPAPAGDNVLVFRKRRPDNAGSGALTEEGAVIGAAAGTG